MEGINPEILIWARKRAQLSQEEAVEKLRIDDTKSLSGLEHLVALEKGEKQPTPAMLEKMAHVYRQSLLVFYLPNPPVVANRGADFRKTPQKSDLHKESLLDFLLRDIRVSQKLVRELLLDESDCEVLPFVKSKSMSDGKVACVQTIESLIDMDTKSYRALKDSEKAFKVLRKKIEQQGVFVLLKSDLGSYHTRISPISFRGFVISDEIAPFIVINEQDSVPARSFTLLHELVHLLLGDTGVSSGEIGTHQEEAFCNAVASEFLLPGEELSELHIYPQMEIDEVREVVEIFAKTRHLSHAMVVYRAHQANLISAESYRELINVFQGLWQQSRANKSDVKVSSRIIKRHRIGGRLLKLVSRMMADNQLTSTKAARILGVNPTSVHSLIRGN